ncbi:MAG: hypothetical protein H7338_05890 [Candidatus Sericytochromatia bacterium]|nr:hypothetical protein [Candidatus Sericytochromatia bacterium]
MPHSTHETHTHQHGDACGHPRILWLDKEAFLHDGHLHLAHGGHWDETQIDVTSQNPTECRQTACVKNHTDYPAVPHGDHVDHLINGRLHRQHAGHCDDHGAVKIAA